MWRKSLAVAGLLLVLMPRLTAAATGGVEVETSLSQTSDGMAIHLVVHNKGQAPVGVVGATPCDPGIRAVLTTPDGREQTLPGKTPFPLGTCELMVLKEHEIQPQGQFVVDYYVRTGPAPVLGTYSVAFTTPLASYAKRPALQITKPFTFTIPFVDVVSHWAREQIAQAVSQGWVKGYPDGTFRPDQPLSVGELVKMLALVRGLTPVPGPEDRDWASPWLTAAVRAGWVEPGMTGQVHTFDAVMILVRASGLPESKEVREQREANRPLTRAEAIALILQMQSATQ